MSELRNARHMLDRAEHAAIAGDLTSADELLRGAARIQEAELGSLHPDLANTLNNLGVVAERTGRLGEAETFYRRAAAIASAALPADHPMVTDSRKNLEDFCSERGLPIHAAAVTTHSAPDTEFGLTVPRPPTPTARQPLPSSPHRARRPLAWVAIGVIVLVTAALFARRPSSRETPTPIPTRTAAPTAPRAVDPAPPPPVTPAPIEQARPATAVPSGKDRDVVTGTPRASAPSAIAIRVAAAQLCQNFPTRGGGWRCKPAGDSVSRGTIALYTRVRSPRDTVVVHRWYRGDSLRQSVRLTIHANTWEGYRTYSRQIVDRVGDWRVEVMSVDGELLHQQRFAVR
jgi:hypothetical protein